MFRGVGAHGSSQSPLSRSSQSVRTGLNYVVFLQKNKQNKTTQDLGSLPESAIKRGCKEIIRREGSLEQTFQKSRPLMDRGEKRPVREVP